MPEVSMPTLFLAFLVEDEMTPVFPEGWIPWKFPLIIFFED